MHVMKWRNPTPIYLVTPSGGKFSAMNLDTIERQVQNSHVLVIFPSDENRGALLKAIAEAGSVPLICHTFEEAREIMKCKHIQIIVCEDHLPRAAVQAILKLAKHRRRPIPVVISSRTGEWEEFLRALRQGAFDYLSSPPQPGEVKRVLELALAESRHVRGRDKGSAEPPQFCANEFVVGLGENKFE
jgi:DNA-binding NtrC family response regulator